MRGATRISNLAYRASQWVDRRVEDYRYDERHLLEADRAYETICAQEPDRRPDARVLKQIDGYAGDVLGSSSFAPWLRVYTAWSGSFREGWIPDNYHGRVVLPAVQGPARDLSRFKTLARRLFLAGDRIPDVAYRIRGQWTDVEGRSLAPGEVESVVFRDGPRVVVKSDDSNQGRGVSLVEKGRDDILGMDDWGDFVVQRWIPQSDFLRRFNPDNMATLRITTVKANGNPASMRASFLLFGRPGPEVLLAAGAIRVAVMDRKGTLAAVGAFADWSRVTHHPDSGLPFAGEVIPGFAEAREECERLHDAFPHVTVIGWDVGFTTGDDFVILDWNSVHPDLKFTEANSGPDCADLGWEDLWKEGRGSSPG